MSNYLYGLIVIAALLAIPAITIAYWNSDKKTEITVEDKENVNRSQSSQYLIYTDKGVFQVDDSYLAWEFDSSDKYAALKRNKTYIITTLGWRWHFASMYPNIINIEEPPL